MTLPPGPRAPAAVNALRFYRRPLETLREWHARYGDLFTVSMTGFGTGIYVVDPGAIKELFTGDQSDLRAGEANSFLEPVLGPHSVLVLDGPEHMRQRKLLLPPFQGARVSGFRDVIRSVAEREVARWYPGRRLVLRERMRALTFEVICRAVFGVTAPERVERLRTALVAVIDSHPIFMVARAARADLGPLSPGRRFTRRLRKADGLLYEEIQRRRREPDLDERGDVLSLLLRARDEDGRPMTDQELRDELFTMLGAGHETTATALAFAFELLLRNPSVHERLREAIAAEDGDAYLDAVVRETLRLRPVIDAAERTLTAPRTVAGWDLPAGVKVYPAIALVQMREDLYPRAREFRPERFLDEEAESYSWLPFGGGIRRCIGAALAQLEMVEVLRVAVPAVRLRPLRDRPDPVVLRGITLAPRHGVEVEAVGGRVAARFRSERILRRNGMSENGGVDWRITGEEVGSCSCDWACPCQFEGDPTHGYCRVIGVIQIAEGHFGDVDLSGAKFGIIISFPGPLYEGNGTIQLVTDEAASEEQRDAMEKLASGEHGGAFFEIFSAICPDKREPVVAAIEIDSDRERRVASIRIGDFAASTIEPIKSPATGEEHRVRIDLPNGFEYKQAEVGNTVQASASAEEPLSFSFERSYAQLNKFDWSPAAA